MKKLFLTLKRKRLTRKMKRLNPNPTEYKYWEHTGWGNSIVINRNKKISEWSFEIRGHLSERPKVGDKLIYEISNGKYAFGYIIDVEYVRDPNDMFFAKVVPIAMWKEKNA